MQVCCVYVSYFIFVLLFCNVLLPLQQHVVTLFFFPSKQLQEATVDCLCQRVEINSSVSLLMDNELFQHARLQSGKKSKDLRRKKMAMKTSENDCALCVFSWTSAATQRSGVVFSKFESLCLPSSWVRPTCLSLCTLCSSAILRPAHISFTARCQSSVSVFRLASNTLPMLEVWMWSDGVRTSTKGVVASFTSCRDTEVLRINPSATAGLGSVLAFPPGCLETLWFPGSPVAPAAAGRGVSVSWRWFPRRTTSWRRTKTCTRTRCGPGGRWPRREGPRPVPRPRPPSRRYRRLWRARGRPAASGLVVVVEVGDVGVDNRGRWRNTSTGGTKNKIATKNHLRSLHAASHTSKVK